MSPDSISQRTVDVETTFGRITVRRLPWKKTLLFLKTLAGNFTLVQDLLRSARGAADEPSADKLNLVALLLPKLPDVVLGVEGLADLLLQHAAGIERERIESLDTVDALRLIEAALEVNLDDDLKNSCAGIAGRLGVMAAISAKSSAKSTTP